MLAALIAARRERLGQSAERQKMNRWTAPSVMDWKKADIDSACMALVLAFREDSATTEQDNRRMSIEEGRNARDAPLSDDIDDEAIIEFPDAFDDSPMPRSSISWQQQQHNAPNALASGDRLISDWGIESPPLQQLRAHDDNSREVDFSSSLDFSLGGANGDDDDDDDDHDDLNYNDEDENDGAEDIVLDDFFADSLRPGSDAPSHEACAQRDAPAIFDRVAPAHDFSNLDALRPQLLTTTSTSLLQSLAHLPAMKTPPLSTGDAISAFNDVRNGGELPLHVIHTVLQLLTPPTWHVIVPDLVRARRNEYPPHTQLPPGAHTLNILIPVTHRDLAANNVGRPPAENDGNPSRWSIAAYLPRQQIIAIDTLGQGEAETAPADAAARAFLASLPRMAADQTISRVAHPVHAEDTGRMSLSLVLRSLFYLAVSSRSSAIDDSTAAQIVMVILKTLSPEHCRIREERIEPAARPIMTVPQMRSLDAIIGDHVLQLSQHLAALQRARETLDATRTALGYVQGSVHMAIQVAESTNNDPAATATDSADTVVNPQRIEALRRQARLLAEVMCEVNGMLNHVRHNDPQTRKELADTEKEQARRA